MLKMKQKKAKRRLDHRKIEMNQKLEAADSDHMMNSKFHLILQKDQKHRMNHVIDRD
jgi:hypothetical protein